MGQPHAHFVLNLDQVLQHGRVWTGQSGIRRSFEVGAKLNLAAFDLAADQLAQGGLLRPQFIGQAKSQIEVAAVDRADFHPQPQAHR